MLTSLNIATDGLLDRGSKPSLSIAARGLIRTAEAAIEVVKQGGSFFKGEALKYAKIIKEDKEILDTIIQSFISGIFD